MKEITDYTTELKQGGFQCVFFYLEGCQACNEIKPKVEEISKKHSSIQFSKVNLSKEENIPLYKKFITDKEPMVKLSLHDDGSPILDADGKPLFTYVYEEDGTILEDTPVSAPHFFLFHNESADGDDEYGFLGDVNGDIDRLEGILTELEGLIENE